MMSSFSHASNESLVNKAIDRTVDVNGYLKNKELGISIWCQLTIYPFDEEFQGF